LKTLGSFCLVAAIGLFIVGCESDDRVTDDGIEELSTHGNTIIAKLDTIILPVVDFENTSVEEAIDFLRQRSIELDPDKEPTRKGISFIVRQSRVIEESTDDVSIGLNPYSASLDHPVNYAAKNVRILDVLSEIARQGKLDAYLTSVGIIVTPEGDPPFPNPKAAKGEVWKVLRKAK